MGADFLPLFAIPGLFAAWAVGRWGPAVVALPLAFFHGSLFGQASDDRCVEHCFEATTTAVAWAAVAVTAVAFAIGLRTRPGR
jgi:hypothetical protein